MPTTNIVVHITNDDGFLSGHTDMVKLILFLLDSGTLHRAALNVYHVQVRSSSKQTFLHQ